MADQRIRAVGYEAIPESDLVMITAGLRRKPDESRLDLINRNVELFLNILGQVKAAGPKKDAIVLVVSNPVDVLTYLATTQIGLPSTQVIGLGTMLDSARFRSLIADAIKLPATQVTATILGEHGDSMVPIWSAAQAAGLPLEKFPGWSSPTADALFTRTKGSGAEVIKLKGGAGFAVGIAIREVVHAVALDSKRILPVSSLVSGTLWDARRLHVGPHRRRPEGGRGSTRNRALAEGSVGAATFGAGAARDDRPGSQEEPRGGERSAAPAASFASKPSSNGGAVRVTMGGGGMQRQ